MTEAIRYKAFISYSHRDSPAVRWLHRKLEGYRAPKALRGSGVPERLTPVFRDRDEHASSSALSDSIQAALDASAALVVACSPAAVTSRWVNEEVKYFRSRHPERKVFAFILAGDPRADPRAYPERACFPPALILRDIGEPEGSIVEPAAPDSRKDADGRDMAFLKLAAGLLDVPFDTLRQREARRQQQRWALLGAGSLGLSAIFAVLAWQAMVARDMARVEQARAELEAETARQTSDFMVSLFQVSDPSESRGNSITAREILDQGVKRIEGAAFAKPMIKARLLITMGNVYSYLGLYPRSLGLFGSAKTIVSVPEPSAEESRQRVELLLRSAEQNYLMGDYEAAGKDLKGIGVLEQDLQDRLQLEARKARIEGDILFQSGDDPGARAAYQRSLNTLDTNETADPVERARSLGGLGRILSFAGAHKEAIPLLVQSHELLLDKLGRDSPHPLAALVELAGAYYQSGDSQKAETLFRESLAIGEKIYGPDHPEVGTYLNNLALVRLEACNCDEAEPLLIRSLKSDQVSRKEGFDDMVYNLNNLALVRRGQGRMDEAELALRQALPIAFEHKHRMLGPIRNNLADLACDAGRRGEGAALAREAIEANTAEYGAEQWRTAQSRLTLAYCALPETPESPEALDALLDTVMARWSGKGVYVHRALSQRHVIALTGGGERSAHQSYPRGSTPPAPAVCQSLAQ
jgi:tetratricopeptide (TPR) repeat protein